MYKYVVDSEDLMILLWRNRSKVNLEYVSYCSFIVVQARSIIF